MYRNEWDAAVARASALEQQLRDAQSGQQADAATIANLTQQLQQANAELARLRGQGGYGYPPPPPAYGYGGYPGGYGGAFPVPARGGTILVFGILSLVVCSILGPIAWSMGNEELRRIERGEVDPSTRGNVTAGRICGMIASILMIISLGLILFVFVLAAGASH
ncbi:MAG: hypothetical protein JNK64_15050 [Myxococcales bacterium]|nr:hypothetical protein [Myxococcales bacterium]